MQWRLAMCLVGSLWGVLLPGIWWSAVRNHGGLVAQWTLLPAGYACLQVLLRLSYSSVDWDSKSLKVQEAARRRSCDLRGTLTEETLLLMHSENDVIASP
jgi:hypothetical protein